jgi:bloom syndrome protein
MQLLSQELMQLDDEIERIEEEEEKEGQGQHQHQETDDPSNVSLTMHPEEILPEPSAPLDTLNSRNSLSMKEEEVQLQIQPKTPTTQRRNSTMDDSPQCPFSVQQITDALQQTFQIRQFRENQLGIIQTTLSGQDVFVIMRTGGGKSLTYQLPMALERPSSKITVVISPLLSLIQDQQEQTNQFLPGSCVSFTSGMGASEHTKNWQRVRDPEEGVGMILVTPEKLSDQGRLARFVIDECHCACQWGTSSHL